MILQTKDLADYSQLRFGWLFTADQEKGHYDGFHVETRYVASVLDKQEEQEAFKIYDVWTDTRPDTIVHGVNSVEVPLDRLQDFNVMPVKCFKKCENGICTFNAHFWRFFQTKDDKDYQFVEEEDRLMFMMGYFEVRSIKTGVILAKGQGDDIKAKMGRIRD